MKRIFVVAIVLVFGCSFAYAGWDDFKKKASGAIERTREAGRKTRDFGKRTKKSWDDGSKKRRDIYDSAKKNARNAVKKGREAGRKSRDFGKKVKKSWDDDYERRKKIYDKTKRSYNRAADRIRDPETRRQAKDMIDKGLELRQKWKDAKREGATRSINALSNFPIGGSTFGEFAKKKLGNKFPGLRGTGLLEDDAAIALMLGDKGFFVKEIDFIEVGGEKLSVVDAIGKSSPFDVDKTMRCLAVAGAVEGLSSADDVDGAVGALINAMDVANN